jgi:sterol desaturase/sphingolipid hydroxylase (fatty acid hydroxylase superfamily)
MFSNIYLVFPAATVSAFGFFRYNNYPLTNPNESLEIFHKKWKQLVLINVGGFIEYNIVLSNIHSWDTREHTIGQSIMTIFAYSAYIEFLYYVSHYINHLPLFYKKIHAQHHESHDVYPIDTFYLSFIDLQYLFFALHAPLLQMDIRIDEYIFVTYIYILFSYISHSQLFHRHHYIHHKFHKCNYSLMIPYFDYIFGTYR